MNKGRHLAVALLLASSITAMAQGVPVVHVDESPLQQRYSDAAALLAKGDLEQAKFQYELFLADILRRVANGRAEAGKYNDAAPLFDEALTLHPNESALRLDYAEATLNAHDLPTVRRLVQQSLGSSARDSQDNRAPKLHWLLGQALLGMDDNIGAKQQFSEAVAADPSFENQYAMGQAYLALLDKNSAAKLFAKMLTQFKNSARIHMQFGLAFARADFPEEAIPEFKKVLAMDGTMRDAPLLPGRCLFEPFGLHRISSS